jgi:hypothetical protein
MFGHLVQSSILCCRVRSRCGKRPGTISNHGLSASDGGTLTSICVPKNWRDMLRARPYVHEYTRVYHERILAHLRKVIHVQLHIHREDGVWRVSVRVWKVQVAEERYCYGKYIILGGFNAFQAWVKFVGRMADVEGSRNPTRHIVARGANTLAHDSMQTLPFIDYKLLLYYNMVSLYTFACKPKSSTRSTICQLRNPSIPIGVKCLETRLLVFTSEYGIYNSLTQYLDVVTIKRKVFRGQVVLLRQGTAEDTNIVSLRSISTANSTNGTNACTERATGTELCLHMPKWWSLYVPVIIFACTLQLRHNSTPMFCFSMLF